MRLRTQVYLKYSLLFSFLFAILNLLSAPAAAQAAGQAKDKQHPWMNTSLSPDRARVRWSSRP